MMNCVSWSEAVLFLLTSFLALSKEFTLFGAHTGCSRTLESSSGSFQSPNYPRNYPVNTACVWVITIKDKTKTIKLTFDAFNLEEHEKCRYDYLLVRDGDSPLSPVIGKYCGISLPSYIRSTGNKLWITFYSDSVFTSSGFRASYVSDKLPKTRLPSPTSITSDKEKVAVCGGILSGENGEITSPNYPGKYPRNTICKWKIANKDPAVSIKIEFLDFKLEHGYLCQHDYVLIRDEYSDSQTIGKYCGRETPQPIYAQSMEIEFKSDRTHNRRGFMAIWRKVPKPTSHTSQVETRKPSQPECGGYQSGFVGSIRSKGYPDNYHNHQHCEWVLVSEPYTKLQLRFSNFDLEYSRGCLYDYVEVHDGVNNNSPLLGKYCGQEIPQLISASSNALYVVFHSDGSDTRGGFEGTWVADITQAGENNYLSENQPRMALDVSGSCGGIQRGSQGTIRSPNFPQKYPKLSNCVWDIEGSQDKNIELRFKSMDVEYHRQCKYDRIIVRDGVSSSDAVLGRFCGRSLPKPIRSNGRQMRVRFFSDSTSEGNGFELQWKLVKRKDEKRRCGGLLNGERGTIVSPDYGKSPGRRYICTWRITVPINKKIKITFKDLDIRAHPSCGFGYVQIHDGGDSRSNEIGLFCGSFTPKAITTSTNKVLIGYLSDGSRRTRGFNLEWESTTGGDTSVPTQIPSKDATPCDSVLREESGIITMNKGIKNCTWVIKIRNGKRVSLSFLNTDLISGPDCREEYLEVREGLTTSAPVLLRLCGNVKPGQLTSFVGMLRISYVTVKASRDHTSQLKLAWNVAASNKAANGINDESCGIKKSKVNTKFVDGRGKATLGSLPWVVGLTSGIGRAYCGASLLTTTWIITAAHCFERFPIPSFWQVVLGETDLSATNQNGKTNSIQNIFLHPSYDPVTRENDIALVQLDSQTTIDDRVTTICLADVSDNVLPGTVCSTAGWGTRSFLGKPSIPLIHVRPPMVSRSTCNSTRAYNGRITSTMICAGRDEGGIDSCQGDGGGPLTCEDVNGKSKLYGISSWGNGCAFPFKYGVYTDVRKYIQWISTIIQS